MTFDDMLPDLHLETSVNFKPFRNGGFRDQTATQVNERLVSERSR
jgi:hypothetical protein